MSEVLSTDVRLDGSPEHVIPCGDCDGHGVFLACDCHGYSGICPEADEFTCDDCEGTGRLTELCDDSDCPLCWDVHAALEHDRRVADAEGAADHARDAQKDPSWR